VVRRLIFSYCPFYSQTAERHLPGKNISDDEQEAQLSQADRATAAWVSFGQI